MAEPLYRELHNMLGRQARYQVSVRDFLRRHVLKASVARQFQKAVKFLNGKPLQQGRYRLRVRLVPDPKRADFIVRASRR